MPFSSGVYTLPNPALVTGEVVSATENNTTRNDLAGALNLTMLRNGTSTATANLPMGGYKLTGLGVATTSGDALSYGAAAVVTTLTSTSLTATRVPYAGTGGLLQDASTFTFDGTTLTAAGFSGPLTGNVTGNVSGNAGTVTNGVYTTGSYADPSWITSIAGSKVSGNISGNAATATTATNQSGGTVAATTGSFSSSVTLSGGTANGVAYLNGSKVLTTGSALTWNGTKLGVGTASPLAGGLVTIGDGSTNASQYLNGDSTGGVIVGRISGANTWVVGDVASALGSGTGLINYVYGNNPTIWYNNSAEQMRLTSTGLGIGTSSPGSKLDVVGGIIAVKGNSTPYQAYLAYNSATAGCLIGSPSADAFAVFTSGAVERMRLDSSGNLGLGVTPSAWGANQLAIQIENFASFWGDEANAVAGVGSNVYQSGNSTYNYKFTGVASSRYQLGAGSHQWFTAPSGTAGNAISFTQAMTLDASGNLLVGTTTTIGSTVEGVQIGSNGTGQIFTRRNTTDPATQLAFFNPNGNVGSISSSGTTVSYATSSDYRLKEKIQPMQNALGVVQQLNPVTYTWKADGSDGQGFIAHELQAVVPDCVTGEKDAVDKDGKPVYQGIDTSFLVATLTKAVQEQQELINQLTARVAQLEGK